MRRAFIGAVLLLVAILAGALFAGIIKLPSSPTAVATEPPVSLPEETTAPVIVPTIAEPTAAPTSTPVPPTNTPIPPTQTPRPTNTPVPPTATPAPWPVVFEVPELVGKWPVGSGSGWTTYPNDIRVSVNGNFEMRANINAPMNDKNAAAGQIRIESSTALVWITFMPNNVEISGPDGMIGSYFGPVNGEWRIRFSGSSVSVFGPGWQAEKGTNAFPPGSRLSLTVGVGPGAEGFFEILSFQLAAPDPSNISR